MHPRVRQLLIALLVLACGLAAARAQDRNYGRSMVITPYGIVATSYVQASQAGAQILARGGSAIDAGIAANAVLGVAEPMMNGVGGDLFAIYWDAKTGKLYGINASGWAPKALTIDRLRAKGLTVHANVRHRLRHRPRRRRRLGQTARALRPPSLGHALPARHRLRRARLRGPGNHPRLLAGSRA